MAVTGGGDGSVTAFQARTGKKLWSQKISKRGFNASVVADDRGRIYASHSEENLRGNRMGAVVCIDAASGQPKEAWRQEGIEAGFGSPTIVDDTLYVIDNGAAVSALDTNTGKPRWKKKFGTVRKDIASSVRWRCGSLRAGWQRQPSVVGQKAFSTQPAALSPCG